jgi:hypothetical protein
LQSAEEAGVVFPEAVAEEAEAEVDKLETLNTDQLRTRGKLLGVVPVGDKRKREAQGRGVEGGTSSGKRQERRWVQQAGNNSSGSNSSSSNARLSDECRCHCSYGGRGAS